MKANVQIVQELYRAVRAKDYDAFSGICTPDVEWVQNEGFPGGATRRGAQAVMDGVFRVFDSAWEDWGFDIEQYLEAGIPWWWWANTVDVTAPAGSHFPQQQRIFTTLKVERFPGSGNSQTQNSSVTR